MKRLLVVLPFLVACPATWGFDGVVQVAPRAEHVEAINLEGLASVPAGATTLPSGTTITCEGCGEGTKRIEVRPEGRFAVSLGSHYDAPGAITLHVRASGYQPLDIEVPHPGQLSQSGMTTLVIVMQPSGGTDAGSLGEPAAVDRPPPPAEPDAGANDQ